jgi:hypothetical protein
MSARRVALDGRARLLFAFPTENPDDTCAPESQ